jgi:hypothetical protein
LIWRLKLFPSTKEKLKAKLELQLSMGLIETVPTGEKSNWLCPIVNAPRKDGSIHLCVDLRMLNKFVKDGYI